MLLDTGCGPVSSRPMADAKKPKSDPEPDLGLVEGIPVPASDDEIVKSEAPAGAKATVTVGDMLKQMGEIYRADPEKAVKGQSFIKVLHGYVGDQLQARL